MTAHDFQVSLGFDLVTHFHPNGGEVRLIREGDGERESTLAERVLWDQMLVLLYALQTDRELLELAAKAAGLKYVRLSDFSDGHGIERRKPGILQPYVSWNPLTDDGDALRLAVACKIDLKFYGDHVVAWWQDYFCTGQIPYGGDPQAATRRAIVRAAAEIGAQQ